MVFGGLRADVGAITQTDLGYTGQRALDSGMGGLMDYKARFYSPLLGRFTQPDTITPGGPQGLNRYSYVGNNPIMLNDPTGHQACGDGEAVDCGGKKKITVSEGCNNAGPKNCQRKDGDNNDVGKDCSYHVGCSVDISHPSGNNFEINFIAGATINVQGYDSKPTKAGLFYWSLGVVTDEDGGIQFYYSVQDITHYSGSSGNMGGFQSGEAERDSPLRHTDLVLVQLVEIFMAISLLLVIFLERDTLLFLE